MAKTVVLTCDLCAPRKREASTVSFSYADEAYEVELCLNHQRAFTATVGGLREHARRASHVGQVQRQRQPRTRPRATVSTNGGTADVSVNGYTPNGNGSAGRDLVLAGAPKTDRAPAATFTVGTPGETPAPNPVATVLLPGRDVIRAWARSQNMPVKDKGILPAAAIRAYKEAHGIE